MVPTLSQVAKRAGVAVSTASAVLRDEPTCFASDVTRQRVFRAAEELNYRRNPLAAALRTGRSRLIGVLLPAIAGCPAVFAEKLETLESMAWETGYRLIFGTHHHDVDRALTHLQDFAAQYVDGLIFCPPRVDSKDAARLEEWLNTAPTPVVTMESRLDVSACDVSVDREAGGYLQVKHLLDVGRRNLAFIILGTNAPTVQGRMRGYRKALHEAGMSLDQQRVFSTPMDAGLEVGHRVVKQAIADGHRFNGLVAVSDLVAAGAMRAMADAGLRIPQDVAVVGFDDDTFAPGLVTPLTSIRQPRHTGRLAFEQLLDRMTQRDNEQLIRRKQRILLSPELVIRRSTAVEDGTVR